MCTSNNLKNSFPLGSQTRQAYTTRNSCGYAASHDLRCKLPTTARLLITRTTHYFRNEIPHDYLTFRQSLSRCSLKSSTMGLHSTVLFQVMVLIAVSTESTMTSLQAKLECRFCGVYSPLDPPLLSILFDYPK